MKSYLDVIRGSALFRGLSDDDISKVTKCLSAVEAKYGKNEFIIKSGDKIKNIGLVLTGSVSIMREDYRGNRNIVSKIHPGGLFAESYACCKEKISDVNVLSEDYTEILFLNIKSILTTCSSSCGYHGRIIYNLMSTMAEKNIIMNEKITHISQRSTRNKLLSYLFSESRKNRSPLFKIPFNRQQLADYLSVDRSAMCNELGRLKKDGIINYRQNMFFIKDHSKK